jgi:plasmid stability protein
MSALLVKGVPDAWKLRLKEMAGQHRRSVNQEVLTLLGVFLEKHSVPAPKKLFKFKAPLTENYLAEAKREGRL